jgi:para-aminobenzoate synthetase
VLDAVYSGRPELADLVDLAVLVTLADEMRRARLVARDGEAYTQRWHAIWDSAEEHYFTRVRPPESFDIIVKADP